MRSVKRVPTLRTWRLHQKNPCTANQTPHGGPYSFHINSLDLIGGGNFGALKTVARAAKKKSRCGNALPSRVFYKLHQVGRAAVK
jgi:hypothetical protein